ncbi:MAG TPA: Xaa-Pro peptidase family protein [Aggregatilineales bacterium]|nr:Xaa-Pro peptidase family protein [Aggregatilineales bacterium]
MTQLLAESLATVRLAKLRQLGGSADVIGIVAGPNLTYLTNVAFHLNERPLILLVPREGDPGLIINVLEIPKISETAPFPIRFFTYTDVEGPLPAFDAACKALNLAGKRIGVEGLRMRVYEGQMLQHFAPGAIVDSIDEPLMRLRLNKDDAEIAAMRKAIAVSEAALAATLRAVRIGMTELQIANILLNKMAEAGSGGNAFDPIVLTGPNTALPHGVPGERVLQDRDLLLFDWGTTCEGYAADLTRTFAVGLISSELATIYETVLAANEAGIRAAKPGVAAQDVDRAARKVISDAGYGKYFIHRTGHGLGLDSHEGPYMREGNTQLLEPGMVFTVEPGIYIPGVGGVRIEDDLLTTDTGAEVLTSFPKQLQVVGGA